MPPERGMSDRLFRAKLKLTKYVREIKNRLDKIDKIYTGEIKDEFGIRGTNEYKSKTVDASLTFSDVSEIDWGKVNEEYATDELLKKGALKMTIKDFQEATGKSDDEMEDYVIKKPGKEPRLTINIKPEVQEGNIKEMVKIITNYPKSK